MLDQSTIGSDKDKRSKALLRCYYECCFSHMEYNAKCRKKGEPLNKKIELLLKDDPLDEIPSRLKNLGYELSLQGQAFALGLSTCGYSWEEIASYFALITIVQEIKKLPGDQAITLYIREHI
jgi:hypothetical protein